ncbi:tyrosine-type recombinase/integrase [Paenibacillus sp. LMG 31460]|uniref:Tyrosine-type recombinase/integrase n=1 Tax=Paenibacillus germinis TaxID=2654979 RepID=A0ABX1Z1R0_9BACL|nr:site-specific integrase [Paenibacillus germinis]NOU86744.1 tyrosine-type recombinase/integrase [Paenibacillus germinis]
MFVKKRLKELSETNILSSVENLFFQDMSETDFKEHFNFLKENGFIVSSSFDDPIWLLPDYHKDREIIFKFDLEVSKELNLAMKGYILLKRMSGTVVSSCHRILQTIRYSALASNAFNNIEDLESYLIQQTSYVAYEYASIIKNFFSFYYHPKTTDIENVCFSIPKPVRKNRDLPEFKDIITFDESINEFFKNISFGEDQVRFFPVYIWWKLTNVIPMRVIEFLKLRKHCVEKKEDGTYWICIPREKKKADSPFKIDVTDTVEINYEMYSIINRYIEALESLNIISEFLIPFDAYVKYMIRPYQTKGQRKGSQNRLIDKYLQRLIDDFYNEFIENDSIDRITSGDTRHFAIMNMFLQGFNMLSIARMAGHENLEIQQNYYSHVDHYVQSQVYLLAQNKIGKTFSKKTGDLLLNKTRSMVDKGRIFEYEDLAGFRTTDYGFCTYTEPDFPIGCAEDCRVCTHYIFKPAVNDFQDGVSWLKNYSDILNQKVKETTEFMFTLSKHMYYDLQNLTHQKTGDSELKAASQKLVQMMDHLALVNSRILGG